MCRMIKNIICRSALADTPAVHNHNLVAHARDNPKIMRHHNNRHAQLFLEVLHQLENLRLNRHIKRRGWLVRDQNIRLARQRHRNHDALPHTAGQLVRVLLDTAFRLVDSDQRQHLNGAFPRLLPVFVRVEKNRLLKLIPHSKYRI